MFFTVGKAGLVKVGKKRNKHSMSLLIRDGYILTCDVANRIFERGDIFIQGSDITQLDTNLDIVELQPDRVIDAKNKLITPGWVNANLYSSENLLRGLLENLPLETHSLFSRHVTDAGLIDPEWAFVSTLLSGIEALKSGVTTVQDRSAQLCTVSVQDTDAHFSAYREIGLRANIALDMSGKYARTTSLHRSRGLPKELLSPVSSRSAICNMDELVERYELVFSKWHNASDGRLRVSISFSGWEAIDAALIEWIEEICSRDGIPLLIAVSETKPQLLSGRAENNADGVIDELDRFGLLAPYTSLLHCNWVTEEEIEQITRAGVTVVHCPISNLNLGSGVMPMDEFRSAGAHIALGTDGVSRNGNLNMFAVMKMTALLHCIVQPDYTKWPRCESVLGMATEGGARSCLIQDKIGRLEVGRRADLVIYDLNSIPFTPLNNVINQLVLCERGDSVDTVIIDGKVVLEGGRVSTVNEEEIIEKARDLQPGFMRRWKEATRLNDRLESYVNQTYHR